MHYEMLKHSGALPLIGVNCYLNPQQEQPGADVNILMARATYEEKHEQLDRLLSYKEKNKSEAKKALANLQKVVLSNGNIFAEMLNTARYASLGQISHALFEVGGQYRRAI